MIIIGLTGSIGMGKSTTAGLFAEQGIPVHDADQTVHALYERQAVKPVAKAFPQALLNGRIDRRILSKILSENPAKFQELEAIIHPLVRERERAFLHEQEQRGASIVLLDIPLLFETGAEARVDVVVVVTCDPDLQKQRVLARDGMSLEKLNFILSRQMPDNEKRQRADYLIDTGHGLEVARNQVKSILAALADAKGHRN